MEYVHSYFRLFFRSLFLCDNFLWATLGAQIYFGLRPVSALFIWFRSFFFFAAVSLNLAAL